MYIFYFIISLIVLTRTVSYCIYEIKNQNNTFGGIVLILISLITFVLTNIIVRIR